MLPKDYNILNYTITDDDLRIYNPYLKKIKTIIDKNPGLDREGLESLLMSERNELVSEYSFTIPYYDILVKAASYSPIIEIGAGSGYWARCLTELGADVLAYDSFPPGNLNPWEWFSANPWFDDSWFSIIKGDESEAGAHPERTLFLAWPVPQSPMAYSALVKYKEAGGHTLIFIGDPDPASSGDEFFFEMLGREKLIEDIDLFCWPGSREKMLIYSLA